MPRYLKSVYAESDEEMARIDSILHDNNIDHDLDWDNEDDLPHKEDEKKE